MDGSAAVEVAIGLAYLYVLLSLLCSALGEMIAQLTSARGKELKAGLRRLLADQQILDDLYAHPLIKSLTRKPAGSVPSYIPPRTFALALLDVIAPTEQRAAADQSVFIRQQIAALPNQNLRRALMPLLDLTDGSITKTHQVVGQWFDDMADRVSGWYKRRAQMILIILAAATACGLNADTIAIANALWDAPLARQRVVVAAQDLLATGANANTEADVHKISEQLGELDIPLGWSGATWPGLGMGLLSKLCGILLTVLAVSLGAPFWFDALSRVARLRVAGNVPARQD